MPLNDDVIFFFHASIFDKAEKSNKRATTATATTTTTQPFNYVILRYKTKLTDNRESDRFTH